MRARPGTPASCSALAVDEDYQNEFDCSPGAGALLPPHTTKSDGDVAALANARSAREMAAADSTKKVLVVVTNWAKLGETGKKTGW